MANTWSVPEFSRNQVDKAGFTLTNSEASPTDREWAYRVINNWRSAHSYPLLNFRINLKQKLRNIQPNAVVAQRIKRLESIESKLHRQTTMELSQMQDIGGCRAIVASIKNVNRLLQSYDLSKFAHEFRGRKDYVSDPKPDGYRSQHLVYQYKALPNQNSAYDKLRIEIQIRTTLQHAWATAVEAVGIFTQQALKSNTGSQDWLRLFALMSAEIAEQEQTQTIPGLPQSSPDRQKELKELSTKLRAPQTLDAYRATIQWAENPPKRGSKYYLVQYDHSENKVFISEYAGQASQRANIEYTAAELNAGANRNVVLVSVDSIQALRKAYPNYFLDTAHFSVLLKKSVGVLV